MAASERVIILSDGQAPDPLFEDILAAEGYDVAHAASISDLPEGSAAETISAVAFLCSDSTRLHVAHLLEAATERLPQAKFLLSLGDQQDRPASAELANVMPGKVLTLYGETGAADNVAKMRRFLRGEGYHWASDLGSVDGDATLLNAPQHLSEERQEEVRQLLRFASDLSRYTELRPMLHEALTRYLAIIGCSAGSIYLWDENSETLILEAAIGPEQDSRIGLRQKLGEGLAGWVAEVGEPILVTDTRKVGKLRGRACKRYDNFSCLSVPITHGGQLFGVVCLTAPDGDRALEAADLHKATSLAQKLAGVIRPLSVLSELRRFSERLIGAFQTSTSMVHERDEQVESLRALQSSILDNIPLAVIAYDRGLQIRAANQMAQNLFGAKVKPTTASNLVPLENGLSLDPGMWRNRLKSVLDGPEPEQVRLQRVAYHSGDRDLSLDLYCSSLCDSTGEIIGGIITVRDVTDDVEMESKLSSAERLALVGKLAAKVAHELNNPLDGILRFLNLALRQLDKPEKAKEYLVESRAGLLRMSNILTELLTFSRSQRGGNRPATLSQVIHQSLAQYEQRAREQGVKITLEIPPDLPSCPSNDVWEVFANVVKNALDTMRDGGELTVTTNVVEPNVHIAVSDTGPGVPEELREKIFEPFFTTKKAGLGTGLGLALCRDSLRRIGGDIQVTSRDGPGATFEILVPTKAEVQ